MIADAAPRAIYAVGAGGPEPVAHDVTFTPASPPIAAYRDGGTVAECHCGTDKIAWRRVIDGDHTDAELARFARMHAGLEDP